MKAKCIQRFSWVPVVLFFCGLLMIVLPPAIELAGFRSDQTAYEAISSSFLPPTEPPEIPPVLMIPQKTEEPEEDSVYSEMPSVIAPEPTPVATTSPAPVITEMPTETTLPVSATEKPVTASPAPARPTPTGYITFDKLHEQNQDFIAWISIPGTPVDYPVVQSNDSDYYLHHLFTGEKSKLGCLFSLKNANYKQPGQNIAIYGHHLSASDAMFSSLLKYKNISYYKAHPVIQLYSTYHTSTYRIFAVLNMKISDWDPATASFSDDADFLRFVNRAQKKAMYGTDVVVSANDRILTLITCDRSYGGVSGRFLVMAVLE